MYYFFLILKSLILTCVPKHEPPSKEESEKVGLKLNIQKTKTMASGPIPSWQIDGETVERVTDFNFGGSEITADGDQMVTAAMKLKDTYSLEEKL